MDLLIKAYIFIAPLILIYSSFWFLISIITKRNDIADIAWGLGYILVIIVLLITGYANPAAAVIYILVSIWALRLSGYIFSRLRRKSEDFRYKKWREEWQGSFYVRSYLQVYVLQGIILLLIALPIIDISVAESVTFSWLMVPGILIWLWGFVWQTVADTQLSKFIKEKPTKESIITTGLWKLSRHPNYFGEMLMWWGIWLATIFLTQNYITIISPLLISYLLRYVSGVPLIEKRYAENADYQQYIKTTPRIFPRLWSS